LNELLVTNTSNESNFPKELNVPFRLDQSLAISVSVDDALLEFATAGASVELQGFAEEELLTLDANTLDDGNSSPTAGGITSVSLLIAPGETATIRLITQAFGSAQSVAVPLPGTMLLMCLGGLGLGLASLHRRQGSVN
jgi:hypothetical protein